jgi:hypothetical protein
MALTGPFGRGMRAKWLRAALCAVAGAAALAAPREAVAQSLSREYQLKAVFLFNFAQFVEWPAGAFPSTETPLVIGILGSDPFGASLDEIVRGETADGHPLVVRRYRGVEDVAGCHILFIGQMEKDDLRQVLDSLKGRPILTVGDTERFAGRGGMIRFVTDRNRIRLRINLEVAAAANLKISSKLLRPAEIVATGKE